MGTPPSDDSWAGSIDPKASAHWLSVAQAQPQASWLHEEVGRRLIERLEWVQLPPVQIWSNWNWPLGGQEFQQNLAKRWPAADCFAPNYRAASPPITPNNIASQADSTGKTQDIDLNSAQKTSLWARGSNWLKQYLGSTSQTASEHAAPLPYSPEPQSAQLVVANMLLHTSTNPGALLQAWQQSLATGGVLFFTCLGPGSLRPLQQIYSRLGWPAPIQRLVDMHDIGDALVNTGFATPVMEMEELILSYSSADALLQELRTFGRNLHPKRFAALRSRAWLAQLKAEIQALAGADGRIELPLEIIYAHAFKPAPRSTAAGESIISLEQLRRNTLGTAGSSHKS